MSQPAASPISGLHQFAVSVKGLPASIVWYQKVFQATLAQGTLPHYGRGWSGCAGVPGNRSSSAKGHRCS
jgi:glyoxylase I family protein